MSAISSLPDGSREGLQTCTYGCAGGSRNAVGRESRPSGPSRSRLPNADGSAVNAQRKPAQRPAAEEPVALARLLRSVHCLLRPAALAMALLAPVLAGCTSAALLSAGGPSASLPQAPTQAKETPSGPAQREHQRILAAYNGP